ncbi:MAG: hypothetical protein ABFD10_11450, partial [Prolixibacteraceae bacterium]
MTKKKDPSALKKRGRPKIPIDYEKAEKLAIILCTQSEIAAVLNVPLSTLEHDPEFLRIHKKGMETGKASLRRMQYKGAEAGNATMLIWLGKQHLGQRDKSDQEITGKDGGAIQLLHHYVLVDGIKPPEKKVTNGTG